MLERRVRRIRNTVAVCGLFVVILGGCSSGGGSKAASPTTVAGATTTAAGPTTTVRPVNTSFSGQNSAQFCTLAKSYNDQSKNVSGASTPAQLRQVTQDGRTAITAAVAAAPAEIKPDVQVLSDAFNALFTELEKVNFDPTKISAAALAPLQAPQFQASTTRFQAYLRSVCGVTG
jgi:hypothetical protein